MTLLLAARARNHILLTADGRCFVTNRGMRESTSDTLQKVFPVGSRPVALAHHGENVLGGQPVAQVVEAWFCRYENVIRTANMRELSLLLASSLDNVVSATLNRIRDSKTCGFWVCGVENTSLRPQIYEVIWQKESPREIIVRINPHGDLLMGGDGSQFIKTFLQERVTEHLSWHGVFSGDLQFSVDLHKELFRQADDAQKHLEQDVFGGHMHQLVVTATGCQWIIPPVGKG